jgi:NAD+ dependent glucose-6-phosphate dehydrogenase
MKVLLTGANGQIGMHLVQHLRERHRLRLAWWDPAPPPGRPDWALADDDVRFADITDPDAVRSMMNGVDAVVHLAAERRATSEWEALHGPNIEGVHNVFEEAAHSGVQRVVFASSARVAGGWIPDGPPVLDPDVPMRPDSLCAVTQAFGEAVGRLVSDRWGLSVICLRVGQVVRRPNGDALRAWLSPRDLRHLVDCCLAAPVRFGVYYGVSAHSAAPWDLQIARRDLGYQPADFTTADRENE